MRSGHARVRIRATLRFLLSTFVFLPVAASSDAAGQESAATKAASQRAQEQSLLDDGEAIARLVLERHRHPTSGWRRAAGDITLLESDAGVPAEDRRRIERQRFQSFVYQPSYDRGEDIFDIRLRCVGRTGDLLSIRFDRAGKVLSRESDRDPKSSLHVTTACVSLHHVAADLQTLKAIGDAKAKTSRIPYRGRLRHGEFLVSHDNGQPWCKGRFEDDLPVGEWRLFDPAGNEVEQWAFRDGKIEKTPAAPGRAFEYAGDLGAHDFLLLIAQEGARRSDGPPGTWVVVNAAGDCRVQFGHNLASFRLTDAMQREVRDLLRVIDFPALKTSYDDPNIQDGGSMTISLTANGRTKKVQWTNWYPRPVRDLVDCIAEDVLPRYPMEFLGSVRVK